MTGFPQCLAVSKNREGTTPEKSFVLKTMDCIRTGISVIGGYPAQAA